MASTNLGRVQGAGMFTTTAASGTSISLSAISPTNIAPLVGDSVIFPNGDVRNVTAVSGTTITCGDVVTNIKGETGVGISAITVAGSSTVGGYSRTRLNIAYTDGTSDEIIVIVQNGVSPTFSYNSGAATLTITSA